MGTKMSDTVTIQTTHIYRVKSVWWRTFLGLDENDLVWIEATRKNSLGGYLATKVYSTYTTYENTNKWLSPKKLLTQNVPMTNFEPLHEW